MFFIVKENLIWPLFASHTPTLFAASFQSPSKPFSFEKNVLLPALVGHQVVPQRREIEVSDAPYKGRHLAKRLVALRGIEPRLADTKRFYSIASITLRPSCTCTPPLLSTRPNRAPSAPHSQPSAVFTSLESKILKKVEKESHVERLQGRTTLAPEASSHQVGSCTSH